MNRNMFDDSIRYSFWVLVVITFVVLDLATTWIGMETAGLVEASPLYRDYYNNGNIVAITAVKLALTGFVFGIDVIWYKIDIIGDIPIIPGIGIYLGLTAVVNNTKVLIDSGVNSIILYLILLSLALATYVSLEKWRERQYA